jgi:hypothetical protein
VVERTALRLAIPDRNWHFDCRHQHPIDRHAEVAVVAMAAGVTYDGSVQGGKVSKFERLLVPGATELPECRCGSEMKIIKSDSFNPSPMRPQSSNYRVPASSWRSQVDRSSPSPKGRGEHKLYSCLLRF